MKMCEKRQKDIIIIVDDSIIDLMVAEAAIESQYKTYTITSVHALFPILERMIPDLILMDINMPEINGFDAIEMLQMDSRYCNIPVIFITADTDIDTRIKAIDAGAIDVLNKPIDIDLILSYINARISISKKRKELREMNIKINNDLIIASERINRLQTAIISIVASIIEFKDLTTGKHILAMQAYLRVMIGEMVNHESYRDTILEWNIEIALLSAQLHDIGKIGIPDSILNKAWELESEEFDEIKKHVDIGVRMIDHMIDITDDMEFLSLAKRFCAYHHERWDGSGYPYGLKGNDIPLEGRILSIIDTYDALTSSRPYKEAFTHEYSCKIINDGSGAHFDPELVDIFNLVAPRFKEILEEFIYPS